MRGILVIEEDDNDRAKIVNTLLKIDNIKLYEVSNYKQAIEVLIKNDIFIIYMDTKLKEYEELELAQNIRSISKYRFTFIIFISKNMEISKEAFKNIHCYNFYNKNYKEEKILAELKMLIRNAETNKFLQKSDNLAPINIESKNYIVKLNPEEILFIESQNRNVIVHTKTEAYNIYNMSIKRMLELLPKDMFMQSHRAYIINCNNLRKIKKYDRISWRGCFDGCEIEALISNSYKDSLTKNISNRKGNIMN